MPELPDESRPIKKKSEFSDEIGSREIRKIRAQREKNRTVWFGIGAFGLVGWSVAIPTILGIAIGIWLDLKWPTRFSWTLALLLAGATLGCMNAWYWISQEHRSMDLDRKRENHD